MEGTSTLQIGRCWLVRVALPYRSLISADTADGGDDAERSDELLPGVRAEAEA